MSPLTKTDRDVAARFAKNVAGLVVPVPKLWGGLHYERSKINVKHFSAEGERERRGLTDVSNAFSVRGRSLFGAGPDPAETADRRSPLFSVLIITFLGICPVRLADRKNQMGRSYEEETCGRAFRRGRETRAEQRSSSRGASWLH